MNFLLYIFVIWWSSCFPKVSPSILKHCDDNTEEDDTNAVCKLEHNYQSGIVPEPHPMQVQVWIDLLDIVDLDWHSKTVTIFIHLYTSWNDTRIAIRNNT